ncbi:alpha/beta hydrolase [Sinomicrobium soli]|uniref:alpha/beta hydrolase n=1 Tax=Sinomicrobium sp. N-1-3-6 TaxID=2219864 RepID=UPI000DCE0DE7|nr:alpha/beta hydrolase-fold protein [Sinomicrobium sp. N-1-3-6]RAV28283.1 esterase [Sinomicrobium sp. N-1-3-6]
MRLLCLCLLGLLPFLHNHAQVREISFDSEYLGETRNIRVYVPEDYDPGQYYPLILVLNAEYLFELVVGNSRFYTANGQMPPSIVVGIDQPDTQAAIDGSYDAESGFPAGTGADFFEFIGMELLPSLEDKYSLANFKMITGHRSSANFINYFIFKDQPLFDAYIAIQPDFAPGIRQHLAARLPAIGTTTFYYLAVGEEGDREQVSRIHNLNTPVEEIQNDRLHYYFDSFENTDGYAAASCAIPQALNRIFAIYRPISPYEYKNNILASPDPVYDYLERKYENAEALFGFSKPVSLNDFMAIYAACLEKNDLNSLEKLGKLARQEFPDTMLGYFLEAEYAEKTGDIKKATRTYKKAFGMKEIDFIHKDLIMERIEALNN